MKIKTDKTSFLLGYELQNGTETIQFKPEEVIHFRFPHPSDPYYGASPLAAAILSVDIDESQHKFQSNFYKNSGIPPLALETDGDVLPALRTKMREEWSENYSGSKNSGKIPILSNGLKVKPIGISPSQFNWLEANKSTRDDILSIYGVPASKLGLVEDVNRANADANDYTFSANVIEPILNLLDERMTKDLAIKFDPRLIVKHDSTIRDDDKAEADVAKVRLSAGMTTINEERLAEGYEPVEGGDEILVPRNMVTLRDVIAGKVNNSQSTQTMTPAEDMTNP
jgi:HK97 family phage portal protein